MARKDRKILLTNFLSMASLQGASMLFPLITLPYVLRVIGYERYGIIALAAATVGYFSSLVDYSFRVTAVRDVVRYKGNAGKLSLVYRRVLTVKIVFVLLSALALFFILISYPPFYSEKKIFLYTGLSLVGLALFPEWLFQGMERMQYITILNVSVKAVSTVSVFIFVKESEDYPLYPLLNSVGLLVSAVAAMTLVKVKFGLTYKIAPFKQTRKCINKNFPIFVNQFIPNLYNNSASFILGLVGGNQSLGIYSAIKQIIDVCVSLLNVISRVAYPFLSRRKDKFVQYKNIMFSLACGGLCVLFLLHELVFWYLKLTASSALYVLLITGLSVIGFVAYDVFGLNYLIIRRKDKLVMSVTIISSMVALSFTAPLIYYFKEIGAACCLLIGRSLIGSGVYYSYVKERRQ